MLFLGAILYTRANPFGGRPACPSCDVAWIELPPPAHGPAAQRTYDVLVCPECSNTTTRVLGASSRFAWCPACSQRTLETPARRLPPTPESPLAVAVDEHCHVCGFADERVLPEPGVRLGRGRLIPFPGGRR